KILELIGPNNKPGRPSSRVVDKHLKVRDTLQAWYGRETKKNSLHPWRLEPDLWLNLLGETLFSEKPHTAKAPLFWLNFRNDWPEPKAYLRDKHRLSHLRTLGMEKHVVSLDALARHLVAKKTPSLAEFTALGLSERLVRRALAVSGYSTERPDDTDL